MLWGSGISGLALEAPPCCPTPPMNNDARESIFAQHAQRHPLADATRRLIDEIRSTEAPDAVLKETLSAVEEAIALLAPHRGQGGFAQALLADGAAAFESESDPMVFFANSPFIGRGNPLALPVEFSVRDGVVHGRGIFTGPYCGPPNFVHGGVIAGVFDELLGTVNVVHEQGAMTGTLTVRYRQPTPLFEEIRMEGHQAGVDGRKVFAEGTMWHGDTLLAEAEGIFIRLPDEVRNQIFGNGQGLG